MTVTTSLATPTAAAPGRTSTGRLVARADERIRTRLRESVDAAGPPCAEVLDWMAARRDTHGSRVTRIPLSELVGWRTDPVTGDLGHVSGRFYQVHGIDVTVEDGAGGGGRWQQPIIDQPEIGILGILAKSFGGVLHVLMQAKMEPGNPNLVQLSPTVQATRSNYTAAHRGSPVRYLDFFTDPGRGQVIADVLQSEHGSWFLGKYNRNMIVETGEDVPVAADFRWLTLGQVARLLREDLVVNMDARTVLACLPVPDQEPGALLGDAEVASWLAGERSVRRVRHRRVPLRGLEQWRQDEVQVARPDGRFFRVVGVRVDAPSREVAAWTQPLFEPTEPGLVAFLARRFAGVPHLLVAARSEAGFADSVQLGPTVQCGPGNQRVVPPFVDVAARAAGRAVRYDAVHSEEGGRFLDAVSRYRVVDVTGSPATVPDDPPPGFQWLTPGQLDDLVRSGRTVTVQARSLLAALKTRAVVL